MRNNLFKKCLGLVTTVLLLGSIVVPTVNAMKPENKKVGSTTASDGDTPIASYDYTDITVGEAWALLSNLSNGIQIPIDARTYGEWHGERIDTPYPEYPRHYELALLESQEGIQEFKFLYEGREVILYCRAGSRSSNAAQILVDNDFNGTIYNMLGGITTWKSLGYPTKMGNQLPSLPDMPSGPTTGRTNALYSYYTSTTDSDDDVVRYGWDWDGDATVDEWTDFYPSATTVNTSHSWANPGTFHVQVKAEDIVGEQSDFSSQLSVTIILNNPPNTPTISGPTQGKAGEEYEYTFSAVDQNGDDVYYYIEWGGGCPSVNWIGPYTSGEQVTLTNTWGDEGTYTIRAQAKDIYDEKSDWGTLEVSMPKSYQSSLSLLLERLIEQIEQTAGGNIMLTIFNIRPLLFSMYALTWLEVFTVAYRTFSFHMQ